MSSSRLTRGQQLAFLGGAATLGGLVLLPWWRNHALLRDFCDYGLVMAAAGRMGLGERPYVDFLTPIQTLQFTLAQLAETVWGARYLSLTYANAWFIVGSFVGLLVALIRPLGRPAALLVAGAVVAASSAQHTIVWYNAMGVTWLAAVVWLTARPAESSKAGLLRWGGVLMVLWLGGMTKLTYQAAAVAFAILFVARSATRGELTVGQAGSRAASYLICGVLLPLATELAYTGASLDQWIYNVVEMAGSRVELLMMLVTPSAYWSTPHDYYKPMYFSFVGAWGVALLLAVGSLILRDVRRSGRGGAVERGFLAVAVFGAWICGGVLMATNFEIAYLSGAAWLVLATGVAVAFSEPSGLRRSTQVVLAAGALSLTVPAWISAWEGARAVWAAGELDRREFVSADDLPPEFGYLRGMRITEYWRNSLRTFSQQRKIWESEGVLADGYYFINATEWMVRVIPEARHTGLPLWLFNGTTITPKEVEQINEKLKRGSSIQVVVEDEAWNVAHPGIREAMAQRYEPSAESGRLRLHRLRSELVTHVLAHPGEFAANVSSNLLSRAMRVRRGNFEIRLRSDGRYLTSATPSRIDLEFGVHALSGEMIAELLPAGAGEVPVVFRVRESSPASGGPVLWEQAAQLTADRRAVVAPFSFDGGGRPVSLEIELPAGAPAEAGWRALRIDRADTSTTDTVPPFPLDRKLKPLPPSEGWEGGLFGEGGRRPVELASFGLDNHLDWHDGVPELFSHVTGEVWFKLDGPAKRLRGEFGLRHGIWTNPGATKGLRATVIQAGGGRFEVLHRKDLWLDQEADRGVQTFDVALPETGGWIGLTITPLDPENNAWGQAWWRGFRAE